MTPPLTCLLLFVLWTILLLLSVGASRVWQIARGGKKPSDFPGDVPHGGDAYRRLNRAHLNCVENLPLFAAVVLAAAVLGVDNGWLDRLAVVSVVARVGQSTTHILSGSNRAVQVRFSFFGIQVLCLLAMLAITASHA